MQGHSNPMMSFLVDYFENIIQPHSSVKLQPLALEFFLKPFQEDYYMYWGSVETSSCLHSILWIICRESIGISIEQIDTFRNLLNIEEEPLLRNYRSTYKTNDCRVFHINPSTSLFSTLLNVPQEYSSSDRVTVSYNCKVVTKNPFNKLVAIKSEEGDDGDDDRNHVVARYLVKSVRNKKMQSTVSKCFE